MTICDRVQVLSCLVLLFYFQIQSKWKWLYSIVDIIFTRLVCPMRITLVIALFANRKNHKSICRTIHFHTICFTFLLPIKWQNIHMHCMFVLFLLFFAKLLCTFYTQCIWMNLDCNWKADIKRTCFLTIRWIFLLFVRNDK